MYHVFASLSGPFHPGHRSALAHIGPVPRDASAERYGAKLLYLIEAGEVKYLL